MVTVPVQQIISIISTCHWLQPPFIALSPSLFSVATTQACQLACPMMWDPVCATDGKTYGNLCQMESIACKTRQTLRVAYQGECRSKCY